jgi:hypothetical protein
MLGKTAAEAVIPNAPHRISVEIAIFEMLMNVSVCAAICGRFYALRAADCDATMVRADVAAVGAICRPAQRLSSPAKRAVP